MSEEIIKKIQDKLVSEDLNISNILNLLFNDDLLKKQYVNEIRRYSIIWEITNKILEDSWSTNNCKILAIWDINYYWDIKTKWEKLVKNSLGSIEAKDLLWYDLSWLWNIELRKSLFNYMNKYYSFDKKTLERNIISDIIPTYWATDWFTLILDSIRNLHNEKDIKFIFPESSFLANVKIAENILWKNNLISIDKSSKNDFFINENQIDSIKKSENIRNIYYITPVWNPTGEKLDSGKLYNLLSHISIHDSESIIIMDNVYVWLLRNDEWKNMFNKIFSNEKLFSQILFLESLSKTLWTTWIRLWWIWSINNILNEEIKTNCILKKAWFSKLLWEFWTKLLNDINNVFEFQEEAYNFFSKQRLAFLNNIKVNYSHLFDLDSIPKVLDREGIYILLKINSAYDIEKIFVETWIIWVKIELSDWIYIRYAFWNVNYF